MKMTIRPSHPELSAGSRLSRRGLLHGATAGALLAAGARAELALISDAPAQADAAILIFLKGGLSHLDSFDPRPQAPVGIRSPLGAIATSADGVQLAGLWEQTARVAHEMTFIRSMTHAAAAHEPAAGQMVGGLPVRWIGSGDTADGTENIGSQLLAARKLAESGSRLIGVCCGGWDMHADLAARLREQVPPLDAALAGLIRQLRSTGRLERTLVVVATEFGRSPRMNRDGGREHWAGVFSVAVAGAGVPGGQVVGASSLDGIEPAAGAISPVRLKATILQKLGLRSAVASSDALIPELC